MIDSISSLSKNNLAPSNHGSVEDQLKEAHWHLERSNFENAYELYLPLARAIVPEALFYVGLMLKEGTLRGGKNYPEAIKHFELAKKCGYVRASVELGKMYLYGLGFSEPQYRLAYECFLSVKNHNNPEALFYLGMMHQYGYYVDKNEVFAIHYYRRSADLDFPNACNDLGHLHYGNKHYDQAVPYFKKAAGFGVAEAWRNLGLIYRDGVGGVPASRDDALYYFRRAAEASIKKAWEDINEMFKDSKEVLQEYAELKKYYETPNKLRISQSEFQWGKTYNHFKEASIKNDPRAFYNLGMMNLEGRGTEFNLIAGLAYLEQAVRLGDRSARQQLDQMFLEGYGKFSSKDIIHCYIGAAIDKETWALTRLGSYYLKGNIVERDVGKALSLLDVADALGDKEAGYLMNQINQLMQKPGVDQDQILAFYRNEVEKDNPRALYMLGRLHFSGQLVNKDIKLALTYLEKAKSLGSEAARFLLEEIFKHPGEDANTIKEFYTDAAQLGRAFAIYRLGMMHMTGSCVEEDFFTGLDYVERAAQLRYPEAIVKNKELEKKRIPVEPKKVAEDKSGNLYAAPLLDGKNPFYVANETLDASRGKLSNHPINNNAVKSLRIDALMDEFTDGIVEEKAQPASSNYEDLPLEEKKKIFKLDALLDFLTPDFSKENRQEKIENDGL